MNKKTVWMLALLVALSLVVAGCGQKEETAEQEAAQPAAQKAEPINPETAGNVEGVVNFEGAAPKARKIDMSQDPACKGDTHTEVTEVEDGKLANVFVYVKDGLGNRTFEAPTEEAEIDQQGCRYHPHVLGVMAGQTIKILNGDPTTHNIHPTPANNREWNESQPPKGEPLEKSFPRPEIMLPVKCNQHPWMKMYINVSPNPFFQVTGKDGKFSLKGLPPGEYTIAAVHEKLGEKTQKVTVGQKETKTVDFSFSEGGGGAGGSR